MVLHTVKNDVLEMRGAALTPDANNSTKEENSKQAKNPPITKGKGKMRWSLPRLFARTFRASVNELNQGTMKSSPTNNVYDSSVGSTPSNLLLNSEGQDNRIQSNTTLATSPKVQIRPPKTAKKCRKKNMARRTGPKEILRREALTKVFDSPKLKTFYENKNEEMEKNKEAKMELDNHREQCKSHNIAPQFSIKASFDDSLVCVHQKGSPHRLKDTVMEEDGEHFFDEHKNIVDSKNKRKIRRIWLNTRDGDIPNNEMAPVVLIRGCHGRILCAYTGRSDKLLGVATSVVQKNGWNEPFICTQGLYKHFVYYTTYTAVLVANGSLSLHIGGQKVGIQIDALQGDLLLVPPGVALRQVAASSDIVTLFTYPIYNESCTAIHNRPPQSIERLKMLENSKRRPVKDPFLGEDAPYYFSELFISTDEVFMATLASGVLSKVQVEE